MLHVSYEMSMDVVVESANYSEKKLMVLESYLMKMNCTIVLLQFLLTELLELVMMNCAIVLLDVLGRLKLKTLSDEFHNDYGLDFPCYRSLYLACENMPFELDEPLDRDLCVIKLNVTTMDKCLRVALQQEVVLYSLKWIHERIHEFLLYLLLNLRDAEGNTALEFSTSEKELQPLIVLLCHELADVNALNSFCLALGIVCALPYSDNMDIGIDRIPQECDSTLAWVLTRQKIKHSHLYSHRRLSNSSWDLTRRKIKHGDDYSHKGLLNSSWDLTIQKIKHGDDNSHRGLSNSSGNLTIQIIKHSDDYSHRGLSNSSWNLNKQKIKHSDDYSHRGLSNKSSDISTVKLFVGFSNVLLLIATLFATITFQVPFHLLGSTSKEGYKQDSIMYSSLILFNSMVFIASVGVIIFLLHEFPLKPWPHISILALFGSYMYSLKAISPNEAPALIFISIPILLVGICRETLWLCKPKFYLST